MGLLDYYATSAKFNTLGKRVGGVVTEPYRELQQRDFDTDKPLYWKDGKKTIEVTDEPAMQGVVTVDTGEVDPAEPADDGQRAIYIKGQMLKATRVALKAARSRGIKVGDRFWVTWVDEIPVPKGKKGKPEKVYEVEYEKGPEHTIPAPTVESAEPEGHQEGLRGAQERAAARRAQSVTGVPAEDSEVPF